MSTTLPSSRSRTHRAADRHVGVGGDALQLDDAPGPAVDHLQGVEGDAAVELDVAEAGQVVERGEVGQPGQPLDAVVALELEERLLLGPAPLVGGAQVVDGQLGQADPQRGGVGQRCGPRRCAAARRAQGWRARARAVLAVGVDDEQPVAAVGPHHPAGQDPHQVGLAHAGGGEDADVAGQGAAGDADAEVDDASRRCAAVPTGRSPMRLARKAKSSGSGATTRENWVGRLLGLRNSVRGPPGCRAGPGNRGSCSWPPGRCGGPARAAGGRRPRPARRRPAASPPPARPTPAPGARCRR